MSDAVARAAAIAAAAKDRESSVRERNRRDLPATAAFVDAFRIFGKLPAGRFKEAGRTVEWGKWSVFGTPVVASPPQPIAKDKRGRRISEGPEQPTARASRRKGAMRPAGGLSGNHGEQESGAGERWWD